MTLPNFLVIGTAKSGTTALHEYLNQHPQIYMSPQKEPHFFSLEGKKVDFRGPGDKLEEQLNNTVTNIEDYRKLFQGVSNEIAIGESSTSYIYNPEAAERIRKHIPNAKIIAILRNPADRAYASFLHMVQRGYEPLTDFAEALQDEERRINEKWRGLWHYKRRGFYYNQVKRYFDVFDRSQIKIYLYEDFSGNTTGLLRDTFQFLAVDETFVPDVSVKHNAYYLPKNKAWHSFLVKRNPIKSAVRLFIPAKLRKDIKTNLIAKNNNKPPLSPEVRRELIQEYREDILKLQDLIGRDLSKWLG